jgi:hypothetical protein
MTRFVSLSSLSNIKDKVIRHVLWTVSLSLLVWFVSRCVADVNTWQEWHRSVDAYDFLTSPRAASYASKNVASLAYALVWWFPRTLCVVHASARGMWQVGVLTVLVEPFSMLGVHYLLAWVFHLATDPSVGNLWDVLRWCYRCLLLFTKARAWMRRAPSLSSVPYIWQQYHACAFWRWNWVKLARDTIIIFTLHRVFGSGLTWWHLVKTLFLE